MSEGWGTRAGPSLRGRGPTPSCEVRPRGCGATAPRRLRDVPPHGGVRVARARTAAPAGARGRGDGDGASAYDSAMAKKLVIKVTAGADAPERCSQAFTVAAVAVASGVDVSLWLTGESAWFALPGRAAQFELPHAAPLPELLDSLLTGGRVTLCTQCAARRDISEEDVLKGVRIAGAQVFVQEAMADGARALVY
jgi:predicted peroxiredoxin